AGSGPAPTRVPAPAGAARWTVLVYLDGDNNLEPDALADLREMAAVGSSDDLKIVVQLDRISSPEAWDDRSAGDWGGTKRFLVERGIEPTADVALEDLGELNMGDQGTLADFIEWGVGAYPAERYALIIWDHGASWLGIASDDSDGDALSLPELSAALETARERSAFGSIDLLGFDACLMAQLDVFKAVEPYGLVVVASAEMEPNQGWAWDTWLGALAGDPGQDAYAIAPVIVESYISSYEGSDVDDVTLSAFDLTQVGQVVQRLDELTGAMLDGIGPGYSAIAQARSFVSVYAPTNAEEFNAVDLGHFARLLPQQGAVGQVAGAAEALDSMIGQARLANGAGSYHSDSSGISIYFPQVKELYLDEYERGSPLPRLTRWADFLRAFHSAGETAVTKPTISGLRVSADTVSVSSPVTMTASLAGQDIAYVFWFVGVPNAARDTVDLITIDYFYPPGAEPGSGDIPSWEAGLHKLSRAWDATSWYVSNGSEEIEVLLGPIKYGTDFYGVEGVYTSRATGEQTDAGLIFTVREGRGTLARIWGFPKSDGKQEPQPYELAPAAGDRFTAYLRSYTDTGTSLKPAAVEGQSITFGQAPLTARHAPTIGGDYVMGFLVRDIAGNFSYDYVDARVTNP
ncbi:MAG: forkhead-associated protein, partial [Chloroflexales bacterium]|nr:forkhead-associated protein [Chloroflexales bacterium]